MKNDRRIIGILDLDDHDVGGVPHRIWPDSELPLCSCPCGCDDRGKLIRKANLAHIICWDCYAARASSRVMDRSDVIELEQIWCLCGADESDLRSKHYNYPEGPEVEISCSKCGATGLEPKPVWGVDVREIQTEIDRRGGGCDRENSDG